MLDRETKNQLLKVFENLNHDVVLRYCESPHPDQTQLLELLGDLASCSSKVAVDPSFVDSSNIPEFWLEVDGNKSGVRFKGIPGGHEFSSLVLAILHANKQGKQPDEAILNRVRHLKGPIRLKTYIALSCETCPDIVQALNLMALVHPNFHHTMVDGAYVQNEVEELGLQGVPSVVHGKKLVHSGRSNFIDLLATLEKEFGSNERELANQTLGSFDVVVIGGGPAGASAAIYSARKGLKTALLAERMGGQVQDTKGIENLISVPYTEGPQLSAQLAEHLAQYPIQIFEHRRVSKLETHTNPKKLVLESAESLHANAVIIATGAKWRELGVPGEKEYIGRGVAFCPHCDGPYYKGKRVIVVGGGNSGIEAALDLSGIVKEVIVIEFADSLKADQILVDKLKKLSHVSVITNAKTEKIIGDGQKVVALEYRDRSSQSLNKIDVDGVFVQIGLVPNSQFAKGVVETTQFGEIVVDSKGRTSEKGIYAAGDVTTTPYKQIIIAMGEGAKSALAAFEDRTLS